MLQDQGYQVHVAANFNMGNTSSAERIEEFKTELDQKGIRWFQIDFDRNVMNFAADIKAYRQVLKLQREQQYTLIHCHTPIGGAIGRMVAHRCHVPVIYTAHGFHFYKGAPKKSWLIFYPIEKFLSRYTDELLVINSEDFRLAKSKLHMKRLMYLPGVGVDVHKDIVPDNIRREIREELEIPQDGFMITCAAEFSKNKNQITVIQAIEQLKNPNIYYVMCGIGEKKRQMEEYVKEHGLSSNIKFAGFRKDIHEILQTSDCFVLSSIREGLSVALMEAMTEGLPVVCGRIRGNIDLIEDGKGGCLVEPTHIEDYCKAFEKLYEMKTSDSKQFAEIGLFNINMIKKFSCEQVDNKMRKIYQDV